MRAMSRSDPDERTRALVAESARGGDPTAWFDRLYRAAEAGEAVVPWDRRAPHRLLVEWAQRARRRRGRSGSRRWVWVGRRRRVRREPRTRDDRVRRRGGCSGGCPAPLPGVGRRVCRRRRAGPAGAVAGGIRVRPREPDRAVTSRTASSRCDQACDRVRRAGRDAARDRNRARRGGAGRRAAVAAHAPRARCVRVGRASARADRADSGRAAAFGPTLARRVPPCRLGRGLIALAPALQATPRTVGSRAVRTRRSPRSYSPSQRVATGARSRPRRGNRSWAAGYRTTTVSVRLLSAPSVCRPCCSELWTFFAVSR